MQVLSHLLFIESVQFSSFVAIVAISCSPLLQHKLPNMAVLSRPQGGHAGPRRATARTALALAFIGGAAYLAAESLSFASGLACHGEYVLSASRSAGQSYGGSRVPLASRGGADASFAKGDVVKAICPDDDVRYPGVVSKVNKDGSFVVTWDDPDGGPETHEVQADAMQKVVIYKDYKVGEAVQAVCPDDDNMYDGVVSKINKDGTFQVKWDDPDGGSEDNPVAPKDIKYPPIPFDKLEVGQKYAGTIRSVLDFGAFVDIGAEGDGLLHISRISKERVENIHDAVEEGQEIECWISGKRDDGKFGVTMVEGLTESARRGPADLTPFRDLSPDDWHPGVVARIAPFGAFVTVTVNGASADGLVHVSQIKDGFVDNVADEISEGQEVQVRVQSVDMDTGKMSLSMKSGFGGGGGGGMRAPSDLGPFQDVDSSTWLTGKVARIASFGAFVTVESGGATADGLVHITQIKDGFVESVQDELSEGQEIQVRVQSVDMGAGKMSLTMKSEE
ncbi:unnamed protein product [Polarella glacialis]|uniref:S1 motif domain-containing protein n=1 Tax=Polarella glacialis TaxID=89957 RepID=A0A813LYY3_POLGL|nr:unnamed protein product [Polarella glacialis]